MAKKKYHVSIVFTTTIETNVMAEDVDDARERAECKATEEFRELLNEGYLGVSDFTCEAQEP